MNCMDASGIPSEERTLPSITEMSQTIFFATGFNGASIGFIHELFEGFHCVQSEARLVFVPNLLSKRGNLFKAHHPN